mgnify:CR=1 FL=1
MTDLCEVNSCKQMSSVIAIYSLVAGGGGLVKLTIPGLIASVTNTPHKTTFMGQYTLEYKGPI